MLHLSESGMAHEIIHSRWKKTGLLSACSSGRWRGGCKGPPSDSGMYWRGRQHPIQVPKSQQTDSRDILIIPSINNKAAQQFFRPSGSPLAKATCTDHTGADWPSITISLILWPGRWIEAERPPQGHVADQQQNHSSNSGDATLALRLCALQCCLFDIYFLPSAEGGKWLPVAWLRISLDLCFCRCGTGAGRAPEIPQSLITVSRCMLHVTSGSHLWRRSLSQFSLQKHHSHPAWILKSIPGAHYPLPGNLASVHEALCVPNIIFHNYYSFSLIISW